MIIKRNLFVKEASSFIILFGILISWISLFLVYIGIYNQQIAQISGFQNEQIMSNLVSAIRISAKAQPAKAAVIFMHGLGDSGEGWSWFPTHAKMLGLSDVENINFVFPNAPNIPISVNGGMAMPGWFDIYELGNPNAKQDEAGFLKTCSLLQDLIKEQMEKYNIPAKKIFIGGFSQGAAISLAAASMLDFKIGGVVALSGFCPIREKISQVYNKEGINFDLPIFQGHGTNDPIIAYNYGKMSSEFYQGLGFKNLKFHTYPGLVHSASEEELGDVVNFLNEQLKN